MSTWNGLDFFIFLILAFNTMVGLSRGATRELISTMCLSLALIFMIKFTVPLSNFMAKSPLLTDVVNNSMMKHFLISIGAGPLTVGLLLEAMYCVSLLICFVSIFCICEAALKAQMFMEFFSFPYAAMSRKVGGTLGFTRGYILCLILLSVMVHLYSAGGPGKSFLSGSFFARLFSSQVRSFDGVISSQNPEYYTKLFENQPYSVTDVYQQIGNPNPSFNQNGQPAAQP